ncbi:cell wall-binding repeat-containing protein [uncultured Serinicoccus sp.]|uniref:cell wall-binding repeat-containing protein n=1 Tax=uncultured Serinicoccus sp. TaxID=735514 RepID=UPI00260F4087|nr:cell wall-binding repeat-containing protein [uncultured Serinicoccus sp.]
MLRRPLRRTLTTALAAGLLASPLVALAEPPTEESRPGALTLPAAPAVEVTAPGEESTAASTPHDAPAAVRAADLAAAADRGAVWLAAQAGTGRMTTDGLALAVIALGAAGPEHAGDLQRLTGQLERRAPTAAADPVVLGLTAIAVDVAGRNPRSFGGVDLVAALRTELADGRCGDDWVFVTGICVMGLKRSGGTVPQAAVDAVAAAADPTTAGIRSGGGVEAWSTAVTPQAMAGVDSMRRARVTGLGARDYLALSRGDAPVLAEDLPVGVNALAQQSFAMAGTDADEPARRDVTMTWLLQQQHADGALPEFFEHADGDVWATALTVLAWSGRSLTTDAAAATGYQRHSVVERISGTDRYAVAANIAASWADGADTVVVVSGQNFPDALSGSALAGLVGGPVLLTKKASLPGSTVRALKALEPRRIVVLGGTGAVTKGVADELLRYADGVERVTGADRYAVSGAVASSFWEQGGSTAYLATGQNWPDGLTGGAAAAYEGAPLLLTKHGEVPAPVMDALRYLRPDEVVVLGGSGAVSGDVITQLRRGLGGASAPSIRRLDGKDRYAVASRVAQRIPAAQEMAFVATGRNWPDALAGGALAGQVGSPMLLVRPDGLPTQTRQSLELRRPDYVGAFGGPAAIQPGALQQVRLVDTGR